MLVKSLETLKHLGCVHMFLNQLRVELRHFVKVEVNGGTSVLASVQNSTLSDQVNWTAIMSLPASSQGVCW